MKLGEMPGYLLVAYQGVGDRVAPEHNGATLIAHCDAWSLHRDIAAPIDGVIVVIVFNIWGSKVLLQFWSSRESSQSVEEKVWLKNCVIVQSLAVICPEIFKCVSGAAHDYFSASVQLCITVWYNCIGTIYISGTINMHINGTYKLLAPCFPA